MKEDDIGWIPKTRLGKKVLKGEIKTMSDALRSGLTLREPQIVDYLLPNLEDEVLDVNMVQRMTDSGRRVNFVITTVIGNGDGFVGLGRARGKEVGPSIRKSIENAKKNLIEIKRGCGSWECGCGTPHSLPFKVIGKSGSVKVTLKPAPRGVTLAVGDVSKHVLRVAGIKDAWGFTKGHTKTTVNYALATFNALKETSSLKVTDDQKGRLRILSGSLPVVEPEIPSEGEGEGEIAGEAEDSTVAEEPESPQEEKVEKPKIRTEATEPVEKPAGKPKVKKEKKEPEKDEEKELKKEAPKGEKEKGKEEKPKVKDKGKKQEEPEVKEEAPTSEKEKEEKPVEEGKASTDKEKPEDE
jgi:small subunit ribosomal protein S5